MSKRTLSLSCVAGIALTSVFAASAARASTFTYTASGTGGDGPESASATITTGANSLVVSLSSLIANPTSAGQEVSGIFITLGSAPTSDSLSSSSGTLIDISPGGTVTSGGSAITHWGTSFSGSTVCLETAGDCAVGGKPIDLIIGSGPYANANPSITGRDPQIQGTGTFDLAMLGITANTSVTGVTFEFGTGPDSSLVGVPVPHTPEPSSLILLGTGAIGAGFLLRRRMIASATERT
ncbi:MAG TPA: PEP-CTERM sorting domain-containing protein [Acidobacteriaceae bacterium]